MMGPGAALRFRRSRAGLSGAALVVLLVLFALVGPFLTAHDPLTSDFAHGVSDHDSPAGPSALHLLGTDRVFRDVFARLALGARLSLVVGLASTAIATGVGAVVGIAAGYYAGTDGVRVPWGAVVAGVAAVIVLIAGHPSLGLALAVAAAALWAVSTRFPLRSLAAGPAVNLDSFLMRIVDVGLSFPFLLLVMAIGAAREETTAATIFVTLGVTGWLGVARILRAKTIQVRSLDYVLAARALGQSTPLILLRHVLPNITGPIVVTATFSVAQMIVAESVMSYLGVGVAPPTPTWGHMLFEGQDYYQSAPWMLGAPALAIVVAVFGFNLLGEGLRDAFDPKEGRAA